MQEVKVYNDGRISAIKTYKNGKITNLKTYDKNENLIIETPYRNGKKHGAEKYYDKDGNLEGVKQYKNGIRHGVETWFYKSGRIKTETYFKYGFIQEIREYYRSGDLAELIQYKNGVKHGTALYRRQDGTTIKTIEYFGGNKYGYFKWYSENEVVLEIQHYVNDCLHGICKSFNKKGELVFKELVIRGKVIRKVEFKRW